MKTSELIGPALDWAVAKCEGKFLTLFDTHFRGLSLNSGHSLSRTDQLLSTQPLKGKWCMLVGNGFSHEIQNYSTNWSQGGPIIEREGLHWGFGGLKDGVRTVVASKRGHMQKPMLGPTPLIAAMRCLVSAKLGDEVEIPEELK